MVSWIIALILFLCGLAAGYFCCSLTVSSSDRDRGIDE